MSSPSRLSLLLGALLGAAVLLSAVWWPRPVLSGWTAAAVAFQAIPAGALCLQMMMRLIPGKWGEELRLTCEAGGLLAILAAVAILPVLLGAHWIYPWATRPPEVAFQRLWLSPVPFALRSLLWFGILGAAATAMRRRLATTRVAAAGLLVWPVLGSLVGIDWLMSLTPGFASSAFGLQMLVTMVATALTTLLLLRLSVGRPPRRLWVLGSVLLTVVLLWAYLQFLPFFIIWSGNIPANVAWYAARSTPGWIAAAWAFGILGGVPLLMLIAFRRARASPRWLRPLCAAILAGKLIELAWFALPGRGEAAVLAYLAGLIALSLVAAGALPLALRLRIAARVPG